MREKKIPETELKTPGCLCITKNGERFIKTSNEARTKHTLWKETQNGVEKIATSSCMGTLDEKIPW